MRKKYALLGLLGLWGCAYVGDPLPPALRAPAAVSDLEVKQIGEELVIRFTIPAKTMEGLALEKTGGVELRAGAGGTPFEPGAWAAGAEAIAVSSEGPGSVEVKAPSRRWAGEEITVGVRVANEKGRLSPWSNLVRVKVVAGLGAPAGLKATATAEGVALEWAGAGPRPTVEWKVFRQSAGEEAAVEMGTVKAPRFLDIGAEFGAAHKYSVQARDGEAVSPVSAAVEITPVDTFAPERPQGLSVLLGPAAAQLSWERNQEADLGLYRIYRAEGEGEFRRAGESAGPASYRDSAIQAGRRYRYAVSAVDRKGNESLKSEAVEISIP
jgi:hypothetical protein